MYLDVEESNDMVERATGKYERRKTNLIEKIVRPGMTFIDIGANKGWFTCLASDLVGKEGIVHSFEPVTSNYIWLEKTVKLKEERTNVVLHDVALGDCNGTTVFTRYKRSGGHTIEHRPDWKQGEDIVEIWRWDDYANTFECHIPDVVKIDVECAELRVLSGMRKMLEAANKIVLLIDVHTWMGVNKEDVEKVLRAYGFTIHNKLYKCEIAATKGDWNL
jgi:FkbM family methyltransferase